MINVAFASTGYGPLWAPAVASWLRVCAYTGRFFDIDTVGKIGGAGVSDRMYTHQAENKLVRDMLESPSKFTHIFLTESDMILPHDCIVKLADMNVDMATGVYFLRSDSQQDAGQPCLYKRAVIDKTQRNTPYAEYLHSPVSLFSTAESFKIDCAGLGCILIKREVFEKVPAPWFDLKADAYGSDMFFSKHVKDAGIDLWVNPKVMCGQIDYYETNVEDYLWRLENDPTFAKRGFIIGTNKPIPQD